MTPARVLIVAGVCTVLALLFAWQWQREREVRACLEKGGAWDGGACGPPRVRPILRRDLEHSLVPRIDDRQCVAACDARWRAF